MRRSEISYYQRVVGDRVTYIPFSRQDPHIDQRSSHTRWMTRYIKRVSRRLRRDQTHAGGEQSARIGEGPDASGFEFLCQASDNKKLTILAGSILTSRRSECYDNLNQRLSSLSDQQRHADRIFRQEHSRQIYESLEGIADHDMRWKVRNLLSGPELTRKDPNSKSFDATKIQNILIFDGRVTRAAPSCAIIHSTSQQGMRPSFCER